MATPPSDDTRTMFRLISDGEWHNYQQIKAAIAATVPPGRALRKYQQRLQENRDLRNDPNRDIYRSEDEQIRLGSMACAQITLTSWKGKGIIVRGEGNQKEVMIKPGFHSWGIEKKPVPESQDPPVEPQGYTDPPPSDSEPSDTSTGTAHGAPGPPADPSPAAEPVIEAEAPPVEQSEPPLAPEPDEPAKDGDFIRDVSQDQDGPSRWVTNVPVVICAECTMAVTDPEVHEGWHRELKAEHGEKEFALVDREAMVTLVRDVTRLVFYDFQVGMQDWLEERFAEVERQIIALRSSRSDRSSWTLKP